MLLLELGLGLLGVLAIAQGLDLTSQLQETVINAADEDGFQFDPNMISPLAIHTEKLKGHAHLSNDHGLLFALPEGKTGVFTISNKHCVKQPKMPTVMSCLCYQGKVTGNAEAEGLTICYARDMVPVCIETQFASRTEIKYNTKYVDAGGQMQNKQSTSPTIKISFSAGEAHVIIDGTSLPANKPYLESTYRIYYSDVKVQALAVKSHDCVYFDFEQVVFGGQLVSYTAFPRNTYGSDCIGACICDFKSLLWPGGTPTPGELKPEKSAGHSIMHTSAMKAATGAVCAAAATTVLTA